MTDVLCAWSKPSGSQRVDARFLCELMLRKAVSGGRKEKTKWERDFTVSKYDPRSSEDRKIDLDAVAALVISLGKTKASDCTFVRS